jgi:acyl-CoA synthetase (NDP forming)
VPVPHHRVVTSSEEAEAAARALGTPAVAKIISPDILHKTEAGGVLLNLGEDAAVVSAYRQLTERARHQGAAVRGVLVCQMAPPGTEVIVGLTQDVQFGPVVMFGLGGIFVEVYQDVAFRLVPVSAHDAATMIRQIKAFPILQGIRGTKPADLQSLTDLIVTVSRIAEAHAEIAQMDFNPVIVYEKGLSVVDARVLLQHKGTPP